MDYSLIKYHMQELQELLKIEYNFRYRILIQELSTSLNSAPLKDIKQKEAPSNIAIIAERKRRQALENLLRRIKENPAYPDNVKSDIAKSHQETMKKYHTQMKNLRQTRKQASGDAQ